MSRLSSMTSLLGVTTIALTVGGGLVAQPALASSGYVVDNTTSCSDSGPGSPTSPFCTIAAAAKKALPGDVVLVRAGTYVGTAVNPTNSGTVGGPISFTALPGVTIRGGTSAFALSNRSFITVTGFAVTTTSSTGISVSGGSNDVISGNVVSFAGQPFKGQAAVGIALSNVAGGRVTGNVSHDNSAHGIYLSGTTTGVLVDGNTSYHNAYQYQRNANGINVIAPGNTISGNVTYRNEDSGINIYPGANNSTVTGNLSYGNGDHGIDDLNVVGGRITGNTIFNNCTTGINVEGTSANYIIENNIAVNNAATTAINPTVINPPGAYSNLCNRRDGNIGVWDNTAPSTSSANFNLVWQTGGGVEYRWAGAAYSTQDSLNRATGQESRGIFADPKFVGPGGGDFRLAPGSPGIDSADSAAIGERQTDLTGNARVDDPATSNTGVGPRSFDDRGAFELQPPPAAVPPAAVLVVSAGGTAPVSVTADASGSSAGSAPIVSYAFDFGDGTTSGPQPGASALHTYPAAGSYPVKVTVTDSNGSTATATQTVTVTAPVVSPPSAVLVVSAGGTAPVSVTADASGSSAGSAPIVSYAFDFGDGTTSGPQPGASALHTYPAAGSYPVKVTVTDSNGSTATATQTVTVTAPVVSPPSAVLVVSAGGTAPVSVTADASGSSAGSAPIVSYAFDFGDGTTSGPQPGASALHTYPAAGSYPVKVTVTDSNGSTATATQTVTVTARATAQYVNQIATNYSTSTKSSGYVVVWRPQGVVAGNLMVVTVQLTGTVPTGTVSGTDAAGDSLSVAADMADGSGDRLVVLSGVAHAGLGVNDRITVTFPTASGYRMTADEVAGVTGPDRSATAGGPAGGFSAGAPGVPVGSGEFAFGTVGIFDGALGGWDSAWKGQATYTAGSNALSKAYQIVAGDGAVATAGTCTGRWLAAMVTFH